MSTTAAATNEDVSTSTADATDARVAAVTIADDIVAAASFDDAIVAAPSSTNAIVADASFVNTIVNTVYFTDAIIAAVAEDDVNSSHSAAYNAAGTSRESSVSSAIANNADAMDAAAIHGFVSTNSACYQFPLSA